MLKIQRNDKNTKKFKKNNLNSHKKSIKKNI